MNTMACPGDILGQNDRLICGSGTYEMGGKILASLAGTLSFTNATVPNFQIVTVNPWNPFIGTDAVISVGDDVFGQVTKIGSNQAAVDIISVEGKILKQFAKGSIRREDVRKTEIDSLVMHSCFRPGDIVRASVISLGDSKQYFLSTSAKELGVVHAKSETTGNVLVVASAQVQHATIYCSKINYVFFYYRKWKIL